MQATDRSRCKHIDKANENESVSRITRTYIKPAGKVVQQSSIIRASWVGQVCTNNSHSCRETAGRLKMQGRKAKDQTSGMELSTCSLCTAITVSDITNYKSKLKTNFKKISFSVLTCIVVFLLIPYYLFFKVQNCACKSRAHEPYPPPLGVIYHPYTKTRYDQRLCQIWSSYLHPLQQHKRHAKWIKYVKSHTKRLAIGKRPKGHSRSSLLDRSYITYYQWPFPHIINYLPKFKEVLWLWLRPLEELFCQNL